MICYVFLLFSTNFEFVLFSDRLSLVNTIKVQRLCHFSFNKTWSCLTCRCSAKCLHFVLCLDIILLIYFFYFKDRANELYKRLEEKVMKIRNQDATLAACLYIACKQENTPRTMKGMITLKSCALHIIKPEFPLVHSLKLRKIQNYRKVLLYRY